MKVARSLALRLIKLSVVTPIRTRIKNNLEKSILNLILGACLYKDVCCFIPPASSRRLRCIARLWAIPGPPLLKNRCDFHIPETGDYCMK